ncbi:MAG: LTA synthase family protein [Prevotellaceae bacterium]|nr:LTA synthase family protein [Prevotellaceae bacterium]
MGTGNGVPRMWLIRALMVLLAVFALGKVGFTLYNSNVEALSLWRLILVWANGLPLDVRTSALLLLIPALCSLQRRLSLRLLLIPYYIVVGIALSVTIVGDTVMYEFWQFKLSSVILSYAASPEGATNSVPASFIVWRILVVVLFALLIAAALYLVTPKRAEAKAWRGLIVTIVIAVLPIGVGSCYQRGQTLFQDHAATNPTFAFFSSFLLERSFHYMPDDECASLVGELYPPTDDLTDTLLLTSTPDILIVQVESFSGKFVRELGGLEGVAPNLSRLIPEGVFFDEYYSNSFRTDRGTVSLQSGTLSHPTLSLMRERQYHASLPSLARSLKEGGYETAYLYGGAYTNMGKRAYLEDMGFDELIDGSAFPDTCLRCSWGVHDEVAGAWLRDWLTNKDAARPLFVTWQTISSHEPWEVPYSRLSDPVLNAFAYTDSCIGALVDSLRATPLWDNLLIIVIPDHGHLYQQTYEDPDFFHSPMLWLGGALRQPRRVSTLMNQSDIAATLLAQLGLPHDDYPYSRNIFSKRYTGPSVYCCFPAGIMLKDTSGVSVFDITAREPITEAPSHSDERILKAKAVLQQSYQLH